MNTNENHIDFDRFFKKLEEKAGSVWHEILNTSKLAKAIEEGLITKALYAIYMIETYHYTSHNARNQALVGARPDCSSVYTKFCYQHAADEVGHEKMALHDVSSLGLFNLKIEVPRPLLETESLIAYLYWIALTGNPLQRLGYSYWAENCYTYINPMIAKLRTTLNLENAQLTFFVAHSDIDAEHFENVKNIIRRTCKTQNDLDDIAHAMETTLRLTGRMLDAVYVEYESYKKGISARNAFLKLLED